MRLDKILITRREAIAPEHVAQGDFVYDKRLVVSKTDNQCTVAFMEIPPGKSAYPRHYHFDITEVFYVISGKGRVETPEGDKPVTTGDVIVFPPGAAGAHKIWNTSENERLCYIDFDTTAINDRICYPDSGKMTQSIITKENDSWISACLAEWRRASQTSPMAWNRDTLLSR